VETKDTIQITEATLHHERAWKAKRCAWGVMALVIGAALAGFLGPGAFSKRTLNLPGGLQLRYEGIARYNAPTHFELLVPAGGDSLAVSLSTDLIEKIDLERIDPEPAECLLDGQHHTLIFKRSAAVAPSKIRMTFRPRGFGRTRGQIDVRGFGSFEIQPFFFP
jgi:hypothetical protein